MKRTPVISLIGRPNVGKSTIFNRLMRKSFKAMTFDQPGVTRDRHYDICTLENFATEVRQDIILVDTGGFYPEAVEKDERKQRAPAEPFFEEMAEQAKMAIQESDLVLFVVDVREGLLPFDKVIADHIRRDKKPMWLLINKFDSEKQQGDEADFYELGLEYESYLPISAEHNRGLNDLKERLLAFAQSFQSSTLETQGDDNFAVQKGVTPNYDVVANLAIIGAPNAGKSTLLNRLVGSNRALVSPIAGATVDPIEAYFDLYFGADVSHLKSMDDKFRKSNEELLEELEAFEEALNEQELIAYDKFGKGALLDDEMNDEADDALEGTSFEFQELDSEDVFSDEDILDSLESEDHESGQEEMMSEEDMHRTVKIVDTAGIRKQNKVQGFIEEQSVYRSLKAISESDVVIMMVDALKGVTHQDRRLCDIALEKGKSLILCLNKVDLLKEIMSDGRKKREWLLDLRATIPWLGYCELIPISAMKGSYFSHLKRSLVQTIVLRNRKVSTSKLNKCISVLIDRHPIVLNQSSGKRFRVKYASMIKASPPTFLLFTNKSQGIPDNYRRYLANNLRKEFNLVNTPVHLIFRTGTDIEKRLKAATKR